MEEQKFESKCKRSDETVKELRNELKRARDTAKLDEKVNLLLLTLTLILTLT